MKRQWIVVVIIVAIFMLPVVVPLGASAWRLARNQPAARSLAQSLADRFPAARFVGSASYERDYIYISAYGVADKSAQSEIRDWLIDEKARRHLNDRIRVRFTDEKTGNDFAEFEF